MEKIITVDLGFTIKATSKRNFDFKLKELTKRVKKLAENNNGSIHLIEESIWLKA